jgi:hypothetical protein
MDRIPVVHVLLPRGERVTYDITAETTISELISRIKSDPNVAKPANRTICIIYHGRVLHGDERIARLDSLEEFTLHLCFRGLPSARMESLDPQSADLRGFDRLIRMNYSAEQIAELRHNFHSMRGSLTAAPDDRIEAEEEWFPVIFNHENPLQNLGFLPPARPPPQEPVADLHPPVPAGEEAGPPEIALLNSPWFMFLFGLAIGALFGIGSLVFLLMAACNGPFLLGQFLGACAHYAARYYLGMEVFG